VGVDEPEPRKEPGEHQSLLRRRVQARPPEPMKPKQWAIAGSFIAVLFIIGSVARGDVAPGIVGGVLAGVLCFLVLREISTRQKQRIREWDERHERA
jgi:hypothetical protein